MCSQNFLLKWKGFHQKTVFYRVWPEKISPLAGHFLCFTLHKNCFPISTFPYLNTIWRTNSYLLLKTIFLRIDKILQCVFKEITHFLWPEERTNSNELKECVKMSCADIHNKFITIHRNVCTEYNLSDFWKSRTIYEIRTKVGKQKFLKI